MPPTPEAISATTMTPASSPSTEKRHRPLWRMWPLSWLIIVLGMLGLGAYDLLIYTPQSDRPHTFAALAFLYAIGLAACIVFTALLIGLRLIAAIGVADTFTRLECAALATGLGLGAISIAVLTLGLLHLYYPVIFAVLLIGVPFAFPIERRWLASQGRLLGASIRGMRWKTMHLFDVLAILTLGSICVSAFILLFLRDLTLPSSITGYDTYQYHWAVPALLLRHHGWLGFPGWAHANLPFNTEMLDLIALSLQAPTAATLVQDVFGLLCALLIFSLVRRAYGVITALLAVAALTTMPLLVAYSSQSYVESALLFYGTAALVIVLHWLQRMHTMGERSYRLLALAGALYGFALGVKYTALEYAPGLILLVLLGGVYLVRHRHSTYNGNATVTSVRNNQASTLVWQVTRDILIFCGALAATFVPWAIKNWLLLGNPVYPALASIFGAPLWNTTRDLALESTFHSFGPHSGWASQFHLYAVDLFLHTHSYGEGASYPIGNVMPFASLLLPLCLIIMGVQWNRAGSDKDKGRVRLQILAVSALALSALTGFVLWTFSGALVERYALPMVAYIAVIGSIVIGWLITSIPRRMWLVSLVLLLIITSRILTQERIYLYRDAVVSRSPIQLVTGQLSEDRYTLTKLGSGTPGDFWQMTDYVNQTLPHDGKLLMLGRGTGYFFQDRDYITDSGGDWVPYLVSEGKTPDSMLRLLRSQGITYVVYDARLVHWLTDTYHNETLQATLPTYLAFQQRDLTFIAQWGSFSLYRVPAS